MQVSARGRGWFWLFAQGSATALKDLRQLGAELCHHSIMVGSQGLLIQRRRRDSQELSKEPDCPRSPGYLLGLGKLRPAVHLVKVAVDKTWRQFGQDRLQPAFREGFPLLRRNSRRYDLGQSTSSPCRQHLPVRPVSRPLTFSGQRSRLPLTPVLTSNWIVLLFHLPFYDHRFAQTWQVGYNGTQALPPSWSLWSGFGPHDGCVAAGARHDQMFLGHVAGRGSAIGLAAAFSFTLA